jgi:hypothetical protein
VLKDVEIVLRLYEQAGREGGREGRYGREGKEDPTWKNPPSSRLNRVAPNGHVGDR